MPHRPYRSPPDNVIRFVSPVPRAMHRLRAKGEDHDDLTVRIFSSLAEAQLRTMQDIWFYWPARAKKFAKEPPQLGDVYTLVMFGAPTDLMLPDLKRFVSDIFNDTGTREGVAFDSYETITDWRHPDRMIFKAMVDRTLADVVAFIKASQEKSHAVLS